MRTAGFTINGISSSLNSKSARQLASRYSIPLCFRSTEEFIESHSQFDAILLAPKSEFLFPLLKKVKGLDMPTLIEKPVFISNEQIMEYHSTASDFHRVMVDYNRRFYETVDALHGEISKRGLMMLRMFVPELSSSSNISAQDRVSTMLNNTVHMLDLFVHLTKASMGDVKVSVHKSKSQQPVVQLEHRSSRCDIVFGVPGNYSIEAVTLDGGVFQLKPLERLLEFDGMQILEPDPLNPIRRYVPKVKRDLVANELTLKPGFLGKARAFRRFVEDMDTAPPYCDLQSASKVALLAVELSSFVT